MTTLCISLFIFFIASHIFVYQGIKKNYEISWYKYFGILLVGLLVTIILMCGATYIVQGAKSIIPQLLN